MEPEQEQAPVEEPEQELAPVEKQANVEEPATEETHSAAPVEMPVAETKVSGIHPVSAWTDPFQRIRLRIVFSQMSRSEMPAAAHQHRCRGAICIKQGTGDTLHVRAAIACGHTKMSCQECMQRMISP